jgi:hypothetical protein
MSASDQIVKANSYCLNESATGQFYNLFMGDHTLGLRSDSDEQLLIQLAFLQTFKLTTIQIGIPSDDSCPSTIKLFANTLNMGFSDASGKTLNYLQLFDPKCRVILLSISL